MRGEQSKSNDRFKKMIVVDFMWVESALFCFIFIFHQVSHYGKSDFLWYAEYFKFWHRKSKSNIDLLYYWAWSHFCHVVSRNSISISMKIVYQAVKQQLATCACVFVQIYVSASKCCPWSSSCFSIAFFCGPESCKTESYSFLTGVSYYTYISDVQTHANMNYITLQKPWLCKTEH